MKYRSLIVAGGIGVAVIATAIAVVVRADDGDQRQRRSLLNFDSLRNTDNNCYEGEAADVTGPERHWAWDGDDKVTIGVPATVHYRGGEGSEVVARGEPEAVRHVHFQDGKIEKLCHGFPNDSHLDITLPGRTFRSVTLKSSGHLTMENLNQPELALNVGGSGSIRASGKIDKLSTAIGGSGDVTFADVATKDLNLVVGGSGSIDAKGSSDAVTVAIAGSGSANLAEMPMKEVTITIAGSGSVEAAPNDRAEVNIMGSGDVTLLTRPKQINTNIMGSGRIIQPPAKAGG